MTTNQPNPCTLCGESWWACGETLCPQPVRLHGCVWPHCTAQSEQPNADGCNR
jgi:hypothetical protein